MITIREGGKAFDAKWFSRCFFSPYDRTISQASEGGTFSNNIAQSRYKNLPRCDTAQSFDKMVENVLVFEPQP